VLDTALALQLVASLEVLQSHVDKLAQAIRFQAQQHRETVMIGRSHGIHAEPITFGFKLAGWLAEVLRGRDRLCQLHSEIAVGKISGAVGTYANLDPRVEAIACQKLGLQPDTASTQVISRDRHAQFFNVLALLAASIERFAVEIRNLQRTDVLEVEEFFSKGQKGSSAMPHKRNPIRSERLTGIARLIRGYATAGLENVALWHERDISHSSVERVVMPDSTIALCYIVRQFSDAIEKLLVYPERMFKNFDSSFGLMSSQSVMLALTTKGLTREDAYKLVQRNAMQSWREKIHLKQLILNDGDIRTHLSEKEIEQIFSAETLMKKLKKNVDYLFRRVGLGK